MNPRTTVGEWFWTLVNPGGAVLSRAVDGAGNTVEAVEESAGGAGAGLQAAGTGVGAGAQAVGEGVGTGAKVGLILAALILSAGVVFVAWYVARRLV